jgi:hypothetical protein
MSYFSPKNDNSQAFVEDKIEMLNSKGPFKSIYVYIHRITRYLTGEEQ